MRRFRNPDQDRWARRALRRTSVQLTQTVSPFSGPARERRFTTGPGHDPSVGATAPPSREEQPN